MPPSDLFFETTGGAQLLIATAVVARGFLGERTR